MLLILLEKSWNSIFLSDYCSKSRLLCKTASYLLIFFFFYSSYSEITTDEQRRQYKKQFDVTLSVYKNLRAEMDDISDQMNELSRELDTLHEESTKFQVGNKKH